MIECAIHTTVIPSDNNHFKWKNNKPPLALANYKRDLERGLKGSVDNEKFISIELMFFFKANAIERGFEKILQTTIETILRYYRLPRNRLAELKVKKKGIVNPKTTEEYVYIKIKEEPNYSFMIMEESTEWNRPMNLT